MQIGLVRLPHKAACREFAAQKHGRRASRCGSSNNEPSSLNLPRRERSVRVTCRSDRDWVKAALPLTAPGQRGRQF